MKLRTIGVLAVLYIGQIAASQAQGFVFGTEATPPKADAAPISGVKSSKVETAQRLLARIGLLKETPSGLMTPATQEAIRAFTSKNGLVPSNQVTDGLINSIRRVIWTTQNWSTGNYKGREKLVDATGLRESQILLTRLGFNPGPFDGTFGPQTQVATEAFQESQGVTVDGLLTSTVLMNLRRAVNGVGSKAQNTVRILNWPDYIEPSVLLDFEKQTGIRVIYDTFSDTADLQAKMGSERVSYDVVFPTANAVPALATKGLLSKLDKASLKNLANIDPRVEATLRSWDRDGSYSLPYMWYTVGIAWNPKLVGKFLPGHNVDSLSTVFNPEIARQLQACGVGVVDSANEIVPLAAMAGGAGKWDGKKSIATAAKVLDGISGIVKVVSTDQFIDALATGKICLGVGFSGDAVQAQSRARGQIEYRVPSDGGLLAIDTMAISARSKSKREAHLFIDYLMRPQVIAKISNAVGYANANLKAGEYMTDAVKSNPAVVPSASALNRSTPIPILSEQDQQEISRIWQRFAK